MIELLPEDGISRGKGVLGSIIILSTIKNKDDNLVMIALHVGSCCAQIGCCFFIAVVTILK